MKRHEKIVLADSPGFGQVYDCGDCGFIHMQVGAVSIAFLPDTYLKFVAMINSSAAALETWIQENRDNEE